MTIIERLEELEKSTDYASILINYTNDIINRNICCIDDYFKEYADDMVDIYYSDLDKFLIENMELVEADINNFGWCGNLYEHIKSAEYMEVYDEICVNERKIIEYFMLEYILDKNLTINDENALIDLVQDYSFTLNMSSTTKEVVEALNYVLTNL